MVKMCKYQTGLNTGVERCYTSRVWKFYTHAVTLLRNWFVSEYPLKIDQNYHPRGETSRATYIKQSKLEPLHPRYVLYMDAINPKPSHIGCHYLCTLLWAKSTSQNLITLLIDSHGNRRKKRLCVFVTLVNNQNSVRCK
jgi:hypothetical protein